MANVKISQLTAKGAHVEATDRIPIADYNGSTYDSKYITGAELTPYKKYVALISQSGTAAPISGILENTLSGTPTFTRVSTGRYELTLTGEFLSTKTWVIGGSADINAGGGTFATLDIRRFNNDKIELYTFDDTTSSDNMLKNTSIEIRVYP
jgi:hypothetical protein